MASVNCDVVCLKVKFMKSVPGTALVEMGDEYAVDRAITHLNSIKVFGKRLNVWWAKHPLTTFILFSSLLGSRFNPCGSDHLWKRVLFCLVLFCVVSAACPSSTQWSPVRCLSWRMAAAAIRTLQWPGTIASAALDRPPKTSSNLHQPCYTTTTFLRAYLRTIYWG